MHVETRIQAVTQETPIDRTLRLEVPDAAREAFGFVPGQFVVLHDAGATPPRRRAYSLSCWPGEDTTLAVTVRDMGTFGRFLYAAPVGTPLAMRSPAGRFVLQEHPGEHLLMVAGGSGVTPFRSFVGDLRARGSSTRATLLQSARVPEELVFQRTFAGWAADGGPFTYRPTVTRAPEGDPWPGARGRIDAGSIAAHVDEPARTRFYACGPAPFVAAMLAVAAELGIPPTQRHKEQWG